MTTQTTHIVLYRNNNLTPLESPFGFACTADDSDHAEEQCLDAEPDANVVWVFEGDSYQAALNNYYGVEIDVIDRNMLDAEHARNFTKQWICQYPSGRTVEFDTEDEAFDYKHKMEGK